MRRRRGRRPTRDRLALPAPRAQRRNGVPEPWSRPRFAEAGLPVLALADRARRHRRPSAPRPAARGPPSPRRSSRARHAAADDPRPLTDDAFERRLDHRPPPARDGRPDGRRLAGRARRPVGVGADDRLQGARHRWAPGRPLPGPAGAAAPQLRRLPPALRDEHPSGLAAGPAVPARSPTTARSTRSAATASDIRGRAGDPATSAAREGPAGGRAAPLARRLGLRCRSTRPSS